MLKKLAAVLFVLITFNVYFFGQPMPELGTFGFFFLVITLQVFLGVAFWQPLVSKRAQLAALSMVGAVGLAGLALFRASEVDQFLLTGVSLSLTLVSTYLLALTHDRFGAITELAVMPFQVAGHWLVGLVQALEVSPRWLGHGWRGFSRLTPSSWKESSQWAAIFRGLMITVPIVLVVIGLLSGADPIFAHYLNQLFTWNFPQLVISVPQRVIQSLLVLLAFVPLALLSIRARFRSPLADSRLGQYRTEAIILVGAVATVLGLFMMLQFRYLFADVPQTELSKFGVQTYSEYVRKGFGELLMVSVIVYLVAGATMVVARAQQLKGGLVRILNSVLVAEMILFVFSILRRVMLYQADNGLTRIRVYGSLFLILMIGLTLILLARLLLPQLRRWYLYEIALGLAIICLSGLMNVDHVVATQFPPTVNQEVDYVYISRLSPDAVYGWINAYEHTRTVATKYFGHSDATFNDAQAREITYAYFTARQLDDAYQELIWKYGDAQAVVDAGLNREQAVALRHKNLGEMLAYDTLEQTLTYSEVHLLEIQLTDLYARLNQNQQTRSYDRSLESPLVE